MLIHQAVTIKIIIIGVLTIFFIIIACGIYINIMDGVIVFIVLPRCISVAVKLEKYNATVVQWSYDPASLQQRCRTDEELQIGLSDVGASLFRIRSRRARSCEDGT